VILQSYCSISMRSVGIQRRDEQSPQPREIRRHITNVFQACNQQAVWRVLVLFIGLLGARQWLPQPPPPSLHDHNMLFFKLYSSSRHHGNLTQNLEENPSGAFGPRRKLANVIADSCPQFRLLGGFSHTLWYAQSIETQTLIRVYMRCLHQS